MQVSEAVVRDMVTEIQNTQRIKEIRRRIPCEKLLENGCPWLQ